MMVCFSRCLAHVRELLDLLSNNHDTIIAREHIHEETENDKFTKVLNVYNTGVQCLVSLGLRTKDLDIYSSHTTVINV